MSRSPCTIASLNLETKPLESGLLEPYAIKLKDVASLHLPLAECLTRFVSRLAASWVLLLTNFVLHEAESTCA